MIRIAVLASGGGTNLQSIIDACESGYIDGTVVAVISNKEGVYALERARMHGAEAILIPSRGKKRREHEKEVMTELDRIKPDLILLAGYMRMLTPDFIERYSGRIMNIHPALLPCFGGKGMYGENVHRAVLDSGAKVSGCTVHFVTPEVDGGPIIVQRCVPVLEGDTVETLKARVLEEEHKAYPEAVRLFAEGRLSIEGNLVRRKSAKSE